jgi:hypothetical protein
LGLLSFLENNFVDCPRQSAHRYRGRKGLDHVDALFSNVLTPFFTLWKDDGGGERRDNYCFRDRLSFRTASQDRSSSWSGASQVEILVAACDAVSTREAFERRVNTLPAMAA